MDLDFSRRDYSLPPDPQHPPLSLISSSLNCDINLGRGGGYKSALVRRQLKLFPAGVFSSALAARLSTGPLLCVFGVALICVCVCVCPIHGSGER